MGCPRCAGLIVHNHHEWYCINCGHRMYEFMPIAERVYEICYQCNLRPPALDRSNKICGECLDRVKACKGQS